MTPTLRSEAAFLTAIGYLGPRAGESVPAVRAMLHDESVEIRIPGHRHPLPIGTAR